MHRRSRSSSERPVAWALRRRIPRAPTRAGVLGLCPRGSARSAVPTLLPSCRSACGGTSDRCEPLGVTVVAAAHEVEELRLKLLRDGADGAFPDGSIVDLADGRDLGRSASQEGFVGEPKLVAG